LAGVATSCFASSSAPRDLETSSKRSSDHKEEILTMGLRILCLFSILAVATAYSAAPHKVQKPNELKKFASSVAATAALSFVLAGNPLPSLAEDSVTAAHISLNSIPPTSVKVAIKDLPVIGNLISGTYTKVDDSTVSNPSVSITSPSDKVAAIKAIAGEGHLEFDIDGVINTHLDVDIATDKAGLATIKVASPLIPKLPFRNAAGGTVLPASGKPSDWYRVSNLGSGDTYYYNEKTDTSQLEPPKKF
jgi:hypothetical protein